MQFKFSVFLFSLVVNLSAMAEVCDWKPSQLAGKGATAIVGTGAGVTAVAGVGLKAAGIYSITHATTGVVMLGSTTAGASAAGTAGILAGTGGVIGAVGTALVSPLVLVPATIVGIGVGAFEGGCYLAKKNFIKS